MVEVIVKSLDELNKHCVVTPNINYSNLKPIDNNKRTNILRTWGGFNYYLDTPENRQHCRIMKEVYGIDIGAIWVKIQDEK